MRAPVKWGWGGGGISKMVLGKHLVGAPQPGLATSSSEERRDV